MPANAPRRRILVIKHGALGDFVLATGPFTAIRAHHLGDSVTLLTTPPFADFARLSSLFDEVWTDTRPGPFALGAWLDLIRRLRQGDFARVYDLQTSDRSSLYFRFFGRPKPEWSGIARGCSHPHTNPNRTRMHTVDRQADQLRVAGIQHVPHPDLTWANTDISGLGLPKRYALLVPGGSAHRPGKRWPPARYAELASRFAARGLTPVAVGGAEDRGLTHVAAGAGGQDLAGQTSLAELVEIARGAEFAVGNDSGPMHVAATVARRAVVLFSHESDPALCAPRGPEVRIVRKPRLADVTVDEVADIALIGQDLLMKSSPAGGGG